MRSSCGVEFVCTCVPWCKVDICHLSVYSCCRVDSNRLSGTQDACTRVPTSRVVLRSALLLYRCSSRAHSPSGKVLCFAGNWTHRGIFHCECLYYRENVHSSWCSSLPCLMTATVRSVTFLSLAVLVYPRAFAGIRRSHNRDGQRRCRRCFAHPLSSMACGGRKARMVVPLGARGRRRPPATDVASFVSVLTLSYCLRRDVRTIVLSRTAQGTNKFTCGLQQLMSFCFCWQTGKKVQLFCHFCPGKIEVESIVCAFCWPRWRELRRSSAAITFRCRRAV